MCVTYDYVISFNMLTRRAVQNVLNALLEQECSYWKDHRQEWIRLCLDPVGWVSLAICAMFSAS